MGCVVLLWIACLEAVLCFWLIRKVAHYSGAYTMALKVGREVQERADFWREQYYKKEASTVPLVGRRSDIPAVDWDALDPAAAGGKIKYNNNAPPAPSFKVKPR
jgi:hypothetical protein